MDPKFAVDTAEVKKILPLPEVMPQLLASYSILTDYLFIFYRIYFIPLPTFLILRGKYFKHFLLKYVLFT